jgi:flagellar assembly factor FliW
MKVSPDLYPSDLAENRKFRLPDGLVGFPDHHAFELLQVPDQAPFLWLRLEGPAPLNFVVIEPNGLIPDYELELFDEDAEFLGIRDASDALVLNIVTVKHHQPDAATVNLAGPVVVNRHTGLAKQCILANYARYSAHTRLVDAAAST